MRFHLYLSLVLFLCGILHAQTVTIPNIAVTPFAGDKNVSSEQLTFITGKFAAELMATKAFRVLDRGKMEYILKEQGFQQTGACNSSECQVQMGQLLGVDNIISGNLVRFGRKYAFRIDYIDVGSGQVVHSVEQSETGELEDVYENLCRGVAIKLTQAVQGTASQGTPAQAAVPAAVTPKSEAVIPLAPPVVEGVKPIVPPTKRSTQPSLSLKRKIALGLWGTTLLASGGGAYFNSVGVASQKDYYTAVDAENKTGAKTAYDDIQSASSKRNMSYGASLGTLVLGAVLWFWPEGK
jgi:TolB-like protein